MGEFGRSPDGSHDRLTRSGNVRRKAHSQAIDRGDGLHRPLRHATHEPPTFVLVGEQDTISPPTAMENRIERLRKQGTPVEYRKFAGIGHGFGLGTGTPAEGWVVDATRFWQEAIRKAR